jgi:predicted metalloprotease with PDZ domain
MLYRMLLCLTVLTLVAAAYPSDDYNTGETWTWSYGGDESSSGSSYLGVDIADVTSDRLSALKLKEEHGAEITMVDEDAPAGKAGLHEHDVILSLNGNPVDSAAQLRRMIKETPPGRVVTLGISRDGQPMTIKVQLASHQKMSDESGMNIHIPPIPPVPPIPDFDVPVSIVIAHSSLRSGLMVENITPQLGEFFGVKNGNGVLIRSVEKGSRAEKAGFRAGDVIVKVNKQPVHDASDFSHALRGTSGTTAAVTVVREKKEQTLTLTLPERRDSGSMLEESFEMPDLNAEVEAQMENSSTQWARMQPALDKLKQAQERWKKKLDQSQKKIEQWQEKLRHEMAGEWTEI